MSQATPPTAPDGLETEITTKNRVRNASEYSPFPESDDMKDWFKRIDAMRSKAADSVQPFAPTVGENDFGEYTVNPDGPNKTVFTITHASNSSTGVYATFEHPVRNGITLQSLKESYNAEREVWINSQRFAKVEKMLEELLVADKDTSTASGNAVAIEACVAMGLGSFSGRRDEEERLSSMQQLVFFVSMAEIISAHQPSSPPQLYAQEPFFNDLDRALISDLGITTVNHPTGFNKMTRNSFAFCPGAEQYVDLRTLIRDPKCYVGTKLETWTDKLGRLRSHFVARRLTKRQRRAYREVENAEMARAKGINEAKDSTKAAQSRDHTDDEDESGEDDEDDESLIIYNDEAKCQAEFVKKFMESGRTRYECPQPWRNDAGLEERNFLIWRDDR